MSKLSIWFARKKKVLWKIPWICNICAWTIMLVLFALTPDVFSWEQAHIGAMIALGLGFIALGVACLGVYYS